MKNSFIKGAAILMVANIISKLLGAVLKIPLTYIIHEEGMAIYNTAFSVYIMFLSFVISGLPFAVQKTTAEYHALKDKAAAKETVKIATIILVVLGAAGSATLFFGADFFAIAMKEPKAVSAIRAVSPAVLLVALGAAVKSGFQGENNMIPTAVTQIFESVIKLLGGLYLAVIGCGAAGALGGVAAGEAAATMILSIWYVVAMAKIHSNHKRRSEIIKKLSDIALPMLFFSVTATAISVCDTSILRMSLLRAGLSEERARFLYGAYTGYAMTVLNLPAGFLATIGVSIIPIISGAAAVGDKKRIKSVTARAVCLSSFSGILAAVAMAVFSDFILSLLFRNTSSALMLRMAAPSVIFICIMQITAAVLQSLGHITKTFIASVIVGVIKLTASLMLASMPEFNIYGAIIGTDIAFFAGAIINVLFLHCEIKRLK